MGQASVVEDNSCSQCGYRPRSTDKMYIEEHDVTHVICYQCGREWVE